MRPFRFARLAASGLLLVFAFVHNAEAQTALSTEIQPVVEQYFRAIAAGDTDTAFALTSFTTLTLDQSSARGREKGLQMMRGIKALIDANGGLRDVESVSEPTGHLMAQTWAMLAFNNGGREFSAGIRMVKRGGHWRFGDYVAMGFMSGLQEFYHAIANGDTEKALTWVSFVSTNARDMISRREHMLWAMDMVKQQIDANGGLKGMGFSPSGGVPELGGIWSHTSDDIYVPIQLFFNNGRTERSLPIRMVVFYDRDGTWRLDAKDSRRVVLPVAFLDEIEELVKSSYQTAFSGDVAELIESSVILGVYSNTTTVKQERDRLSRLMGAHITQMRQQAEANGGLKRVEIRQVGIGLPSNIDLERLMIVGGPRLNVNHLMSGAGVTLVYNNDKTAAGDITLQGYSHGNRFILHQGKWKLVHGPF